MKIGKRKKIVLNNPNAVNCCREGILFVFYPKRINGKVIVRAFVDLNQLVSYVLHAATPYRKLNPVSYSLHDLIEYISSDYRHTEAITFAHVDNNFLADVRKNFRSRLHYEALRLGWIVDDNKPSESLTDETDRAKRKEHKKIPENEC